jgi:hypothetical protein
MRDPRPVMASQNWGSASPAEYRAAFVGYYAYYGTYTAEARGDSGTVQHQVEGSLRPNEVGVTYTRHFRLSGDTLVLQTPTFEAAGETRFNRLTWVRVR